MAKKSLLYSRRRRSQLRVFSFSSLFRGKSRLPCFWLIVEGNQDGGSLEFDEFRLRVSSIYFFSKETVNCSINFMIKIIRCFAIYCNLTSPEKIESFPSRLRFFFFFFQFENSITKRKVIRTRGDSSSGHYYVHGYGETGVHQFRVDLSWLQLRCPRRCSNYARLWITTVS